MSRSCYPKQYESPNVAQSLKRKASQFTVRLLMTIVTSNQSFVLPASSYSSNTVNLFHHFFSVGLWFLISPILLADVISQTNPTLINIEYNWSCHNTNMICHQAQGERRSQCWHNYCCLFLVRSPSSTWKAIRTLKLWRFVSMQRYSYFFLISSRYISFSLSLSLSL